MKITTLLLVAASAMTLATTTEAKAGRFSISFGNSGYRQYDNGYRSQRNYYPRYYSAPRYSGVHVSVQRGYSGYRGYSPVRHAIYNRMDDRFRGRYDRHDRNDRYDRDDRRDGRRYLIRYR